MNDLPRVPSYRMNTAVVHIGIFPFTLNNLHMGRSKRLFCVVFCLFGLIDPQEFKDSRRSSGAGSTACCPAWDRGRNLRRLIAVTSYLYRAHLFRPAFRMGENLPR
jgi:hypothetical protein